MKKFIVLLISICLVSCSSKPSIEYPYHFIDSKKETMGNNDNKMELYYVENDVNLDSLKMFCREKKSSMEYGSFHFMVFFDSKENADFPNSPFTAFYGDEENKLKHIKAYYQYNHINGYSKLRIYDTNAWEGKSVDVNI